MNVKDLQWQIGMLSCSPVFSHETRQAISALRFLLDTVICKTDPNRDMEAIAFVYSLDRILEGASHEA